MKKQISILGCGWLGLPLARNLISEGFSVHGSTTRASQLPHLQDSGINPFRILLHEDHLDGDLNEFVAGSDVLLIDIPPGLRADPSRNFPAVIKTLLTELRPTGIKHLLFISSTSVFPDNNQVFTEDDAPEPTSVSGRQLLEAEELIRSESRQNSILRFGGLLGPDRHPVNYLAGRQDLPGGNQKVNLIHLEDCIGIITTIIEKDAWGHTFHGVAPFHPTKEDYYQASAKRSGLPLPEFNQNGGDHSGKQIDSRKTRHTLGYSFKHPLL